jgi:Rrf2 family protein
MFDIAFHGGGRSAQIKDIAERQAIPPRFLEQIFQDLKRAGLVSSKRGPRGGYQLTKVPKLIPIGDVIRSLEGPLALSFPSDADEVVTPGDQENCAVTDSAFRDLSERIETCFDSISLNDLCERAEKQGLKRHCEERGYVYTI